MDTLEPVGIPASIGIPLVGVDVGTVGKKIPDERQLLLPVPEETGTGFRKNGFAADTLIDIPCLVIRFQRLDDTQRIDMPETGIVGARVKNSDFRQRACAVHEMGKLSVGTDPLLKQKGQDRNIAIHYRDLQRMGYACIIAAQRTRVAVGCGKIRRSCGRI